jgi:hypothetical protein
MSLYNFPIFASLRIYYFHLLYEYRGRAMAQAVNRWPLTAEARVLARVDPCGICSGQSGTGVDFSPRLRFSPASIIPP